MFDIVDTAFSYGRAVIVCKFIQESSKVKESSLHEIWNADTVFLLGAAEFSACIYKFPYLVFSRYSRKLFLQNVEKLWEKMELWSVQNIKNTQNTLETWLIVYVGNKIIVYSHLKMNVLFL